MNRRLRTVAVVGPDGAGKSTVVAALPAALPVSTRTVYLGVNLEASRSMLPTTRLALEIKRRGRGRPVLTARFDGPGHGRRGILGGARRTLRLVAWMAEEWYRAVVVLNHTRSGHLVICDRHFLCDYHAEAVAPRAGRSILSRIHGWQLGHLYPRPDLVVVLDAPAEILHARKNEDDLDSLARRRREYLALQDVLPAVVVIDATQPLDAVVAAVAAAIVDHLPDTVGAGGTAAPSEAG
ncbi:MAG: hypothetical protein AABZ33_08815 [Chloroflexota bacterium]